MSGEGPGQQLSTDGGSDPAGENPPWVDPYTDELLAVHRAQAPLSAVVEKLRVLANSSFIGSAIDTTNNSVTVYWHGPRPVAVSTVLSEAVAAGIGVDIIDAAFSSAQLSQSRTRIRSRITELGISAIRYDTDGRGSTIHFRTTEAVQAAREALTDYQRKLDQFGGNGGDDSDEPAIAALYSPPGSPAIRLSDQIRNPRNWAGRDRGTATAEDLIARTSSD